MRLAALVEGCSVVEVVGSDDLALTVVGALLLRSSGAVFFTMADGTRWEALCRSGVSSATLRVSPEGAPPGPLFWNVRDPVERDQEAAERRVANVVQERAGALLVVANLARYRDDPNIARFPPALRQAADLVLHVRSREVRLEGETFRGSVLLTVLKRRAAPAPEGIWAADLETLSMEPADVAAAEVG